MLIALDRASVRTIDQDGHLHVAASNITAALVSPYLGREIVDWQRLGLDPDRTYRLLRDPQELEKGVASFQGKPLLSTHRPQTADDHSHGLVVGTVSNPVWREPYIQAELVVWDSTAIRSIQNGTKKALSCGYRYQPLMQPGTFNGQPYDGRMVGIVGNHVALVDEPRVKEAFVGDSLPIPLRKSKSARIYMSMDEDNVIERVCSMLKEASYGDDDIASVQSFLTEKSPEAAEKMAADRAIGQARSKAFSERFPETLRLSRFGR